MDEIAFVRGARRVAGAALLLAILAGAADAQETARTERRELIYGGELMTSEEREAYRKSVEAEKGAEAQSRVRERHRQQLRERARSRGVELKEPYGVLKTPPK